jgi:4-hydroxy-3-methylbut-2-enyl diphosphate reductase
VSEWFVGVGGYNSSNTTHLQEIALTIAPSFHIDRADCVMDKERIRHQKFGEKSESFTTNWLPEGPIAVGITAGASTPNKVMGDVLERVLQFK